MFSSGLKSTQAKPVHIHNSDTFDLFYNGCCNATFWPLFHSMPDRTIFDIHTWQVNKNSKMRINFLNFKLRRTSFMIIQAYCEVNEVFAQTTLEAVRDIILEKR